MSKAKSIELKTKLQKLPKLFPPNENRVLIREGVLFIEEDKRLKPRWCFLFNDLLLETKPICEFADNNTRLCDPNTCFKYKNYIMLNTAHIQENPSMLKLNSKQQHHTIPFIINGSNLDLKEKQKNTSNKKLELSFIYSTGKDMTRDRELWCNDIHSSICLIYSSINTDLMSYAWQNQYRKGNLFHAVYTSNNKLVKELVNKNNIKIDDTLKDIGGHNLLHIASSVDNIDFIEDHGSSFDIDATDCNGWSALRICCDNDNLESLRALTEELYPNLDEYYPEDKSINPTEHDAIKELDDRTLLHELSMRGSPHLMKILLDTQQINMEALDKSGQTALHIACKKGQEDCTLLLLQYGAPPNLSDFKGNRPLHITTKDLVARWLIAYGARMELPNQFKQTCRDKWQSKLDKYLPLFQVAQATDCRIQTQMAPNTAWFDDKLSNACLGCGNPFTIWVRRHHCRLCGLLVCQTCSSRKLQFNTNGKTSLERSCDKCFSKNMTKYARERKYNFNGKSYKLLPKDYIKMRVMETSFQGSYINYIKKKEEEQAMAIMIEKENEENDEKEMNLENEKVSSLSPPKQNKRRLNKHTFSKSMQNFGFGKKKKNGNKDNGNDEKYGKHQQSSSQAIDSVNQAVSKAHERGEKIQELADKSDALADNAKNFNDLAKQLANKSW